MRVLRLSIFFIVGVFLGGYATWASALDPVPAEQGYCPSYGCGTNNSAWSTSVAGACSKHAQAHSMQPASCYSSNEVTREYKYIYTYNGKTYPECSSCIGNQWAIVAYKCSDGWTLQGETCYPPTSCVAGSGKGYYSTGFGTTACIGGCSYTRSASGNFSVCSGWSDETGWASCYLAQSGETCSTPNGAPSSSQPQCPVGQCPGTINGVPVCVPCTGKTDTQSSGTKTTTNPDGSTTTTTTTTNSTSDGGSTTTTTTTNTTNTPAGGGAPTTTTTTDTETKPKDSFCIENPDSPLCKQSSFGGSCGSFSCDGDAIQCAMAKEQHKRNCVLFETETEQSTLGRDAASGNDPLKSQFPTAEGQKQTIDLSSKLDQSGFLSGSCPAPFQTSFMGHQITLDWSNACMVVEWLGYLVVASAMVLAYLIIGG